MESASDTLESARELAISWKVLETLVTTKLKDSLESARDSLKSALKSALKTLWRVLETLWTLKNATYSLECARDSCLFEIFEGSMEALETAEY